MCKSEKNKIHMTSQYRKQTKISHKSQQGWKKILWAIGKQTCTNTGRPQKSRIFHTVGRVLMEGLLQDSSQERTGRLDWHTIYGYSY